MHRWESPFAPAGPYCRNMCCRISSWGFHPQLVSPLPRSQVEELDLGETPAVPHMPLASPSCWPSSETSTSVAVEETRAEFVSSHPKSQGRSQPHIARELLTTQASPGQWVFTLLRTQVVQDTQQPPMPLLQSTLQPPRPALPFRQHSRKLMRPQNSLLPSHLPSTPTTTCPTCTHLPVPPSKAPLRCFLKGWKVYPSSHTQALIPPLLRGDIKPPCSPHELSCQPGSQL